MRCAHLFFLVLAVVSAVLGLAGPDAQAILVTYDLREAGTGAKVVDVCRAGDVVEIDLYAIVQNLDGDPTNDGLLVTMGSFVSDPGPLFGDLRGDVAGQPQTKTNNVAPFDATATQSGFQQDLDGDGDWDVGSYDAGSPAVLMWFIAGSGMEPVMGVDSAEFLIGRTTFTVTEGGFGDATGILYVPRVRTTGIPSQRLTNKFVSDGVTYKLSGADPEVSTSGLRVRMVPEPLTLVGVLAGVGALARYVLRRS